MADKLTESEGNMFCLQYIVLTYAGKREKSKH